MKKKFFISMVIIVIMLIICAGNSQAVVVYWVGDFFGVQGDNNYANGNSWTTNGHATPYGTPPLSTDSHGLITPNWTTLIPTISSTIAETPVALGIGWDTDGTLNIIEGASVIFNEVYLPAFDNTPHAGTLNISGGNVVVNSLNIGWGTSVGTINLSGGVLHAGSVTWNNGFVKLSGSASFLINGNQTELNLVSNSKITASEAYYIVEEFWNSADNRTEYSAVPAPPIVVNPSATRGIYSDKVIVRWDEVYDVNKYQVWRSETDNSSTATDISGDVANPFFIDTIVIQEINYYYWVKARITNTWSDFGDSALGFSTATPNGKFEDVSVEVGLAELNNANFDDGNIAWVDYNNDGRPDIFTGAKYDGTLGTFLFKNVSGNSFEKSGGAAAAIMFFSGVFADLDNDGDQDWLSSIAGNHRAFNNNGIFTWVSGPTNAYQAENLAFGDFNKDSSLDFYRPGWESPSSFGYPDSIYTNAGDGSFQFSWQQTSMTRWFGADNEKRWLASGRNATTADFDEDGDIDVYVSNYRLSPNFLQINDGAGNFNNLALEYGVEGTKSLCIANGGTGTGIWYGHTIASTFADLDNDGHLDLIVGNFDHNWSCGSNPNYQDDPRFHRNMGSSGNWHFEDKTANVGLPYVESHASPAAADFDNDGDLDFFMTSVAGSYSGQKCSMMRNDGNWNFTDISVEKGLDITTPKSNFQAAWADFDNDGDLDLFTGKKLYRNNLNNGNHWLKIKLVGSTIVNCNMDAIGVIARIQLGTETLTRQVESAVGWGNQNERTLHFGLGSETGPVTVNVTWPNGSISSGTFDVDETGTMTIPIPEGSFIFSFLFFIFSLFFARQK